jgi:predicted DCC family thiol-disulfide oxidoreductase YuxK
LLFDPGWISPKPAKTATLFYDGSCGLCHGAVRFLLAEDRTGKAFRFAPIGGRAFRAQVPEEARAQLPDSVVLRTAEGNLLVRSDAMLEAGLRIGGFWRMLAILARLIPRFLRNWIYDRIARVRKRLFKTPTEACPVMSPTLQRRFDS